IARNPDRAEQTRRRYQISRPVMMRVAEAKLLIAEGKESEGLELLKQVAEREATARENNQIANDPPNDPWPTMRLVADEFLRTGDTAAAITSYEKALSQEPNDAWCLAGLAKAHVAAGNTDRAREFAGRFLAVWSGADRSLPLVREVLALRLNATPRAVTPRPERVYVPSDLDEIGPSNWRPFQAPILDCVDTEGRRVQLTDFRGKNVLLVFYLSDRCVHCMEQLGAINDRLDEFGDENTVVLGVSATAPEKNRESLVLAPFDVTLLSDVNHENARRFASYDDFEEMELHATILIDSEGRVRWKRSGGDPFGDVDFLLREIRRWGR
ncbi:MAG: redoxin domain-containing protein, partial [Fimbriimonadaceae bacterium]|nr:redoxin domain-containing protein [Fimbriimonadaceae bacterium]